MFPTAPPQPRNAIRLLCAVSLGAFVLTLLPAALRAQTYLTPAIEDNSFLIEEAFNQEDGVIQHISTGHHRNRDRSVGASFTEEWPFDGQSHQLSITVPLELGPGSGNGVGDLLLNYRYQLLGGDDWCWLATRVSAILPTGPSAFGSIGGKWGVQTNICASRRVSEALVLHANVGASFTPGVETRNADGRGERRTLDAWSAGASAIWICDASLNLLCEALLVNEAQCDASGIVQRENALVLNPGLRAGFMLGATQVVPGVSVPLTLRDDAALETGVFFYLSFEHPL